MTGERGFLLRDAFAVLRAIRQEPMTIAQISTEADVHWRKAYRLIESLIDLGAPIKAVEDPSFAGRGRAPLRYSLSVSALREWIG